MAEPLLKPADKKKVGEALAHCARCQDRLDQLRELGIPKEELEQRVKAQQALLSGALELDAAARVNA